LAPVPLPPQADPWLQDFLKRNQPSSFEWTRKNVKHSLREIALLIEELRNHGDGEANEEVSLKLIIIVYWAACILCLLISFTVPSKASEVGRAARYLLQKWALLCNLFKQGA